MSATNARDEILRAVRAALPPAIDAPGRYERERPYAGTDDLVTRFAHSVAASGAVALRCDGDPSPHVNHAGGNARELLSLLPGVVSTVTTSSDLRALASLELFICQATVGVAENGALWFATSDSYHRAALFLAERVIIVVSADAIVADLHEAYQRINVRVSPFGSFVAGPSKTADIEQALVIGAHGPKELTVIISESPG
ncbi:MAG: lactate utilization protein [Gemmatimonadota bacterium]|nr:lactate utilization protein [Gemmatimonadota bacterium]